MTARSILNLLILVLLAVLVIANWTSLMTTVEVNLVVTRTFIPAAVLLLLLVALVVFIDWSVHAAHHLAWHRRLRALDAEVERLKYELDTFRAGTPASRERPLR